MDIKYVGMLVPLEVELQGLGRSKTDFWSPLATQDNKHPGLTCQHLV